MQERWQQRGQTLTKDAEVQYSVRATLESLHRWGHNHVIADAICVSSTGDALCLFLPPFEKGNHKDKVFFLLLLFLFTVRLIMSTGNNSRMVS